MSEQLSVSVIEKEQPLYPRIELPFTDLNNARRESKREECYMDLFRDYISYKVVASYEQKDDDTDIWKEKIANYRWTRLRRNIAEISMHKDNVYDTWVLSLDFFHIDGNGILWHFEKPKDCLKIYEVLKEYYITTKF